MSANQLKRPRGAAAGPGILSPRPSTSDVRPTFGRCDDDGVTVDAGCIARIERALASPKYAAEREAHYARMNAHFDGIRDEQLARAWAQEADNA